jgi:GT2 family glycosyltransferase
MKISYAITVCNEFVEIQQLINHLLTNKRHRDEIIILFDSNNGSLKVEEFLRAKSVNGEFNWFPYPFNGHFAEMKNFLTSMCKGDYIFQIDADEIPNPILIKNLPEILEGNEVDIVLTPRINTVKGITQKHINKWGWRINENNWINFPDYQWRIYKNNSKIKWINKVHEKLIGYKTISHLPQSQEWCLIHDKTIEKQEKQNNFYNTL